MPDTPENGHGHKLLLEPVWFRDNSTHRRGYIFCLACYEDSQRRYPNDSRYWINSALHCLVISGEDAWVFNGDYTSPTFRPSLLMTTTKGDEANSPDFVPHYVCHSYITDGRIQYLDDCTHARAGQTLDLMDTVYYLDQYPNFGKPYEIDLSDSK